MRPGSCCQKDCAAPPTSRDDVFCAEHWRVLPRWARVELVRLRNDARNGGHAAVTSFVKALTVAATLKA